MDKNHATSLFVISVYVKRQILIYDNCKPHYLLKLGVPRHRCSWK